MKLTAVAAVVSLVLAGASHAADPAEHAKLAHDLAVLTMPEETWNKMLDGMGEDIARQFATKPNPPSKKDFVAAMNDFVAYKDIIDLQTAMLVKHYTVDEVKQLGEFYRTPLGQKVLKVMPEVTRDINVELQMRIQQSMPKVIERMRQQQQPEKKDGAAKAKSR